MSVERAMTSTTDNVNNNELQLLHNLEQLLECPVCVEPFDSGASRTPTTLGCGHTLCLEHVARLQHRSCPICRAPFPEQQRLERNVLLCQIVDCLPQQSGRPRPLLEKSERTIIRLKNNNNPNEDCFEEIQQQNSSGQHRGCFFSSLRPLLSETIRSRRENQRQTALNTSRWWRRSSSPRLYPLLGLQITRTTDRLGRTITLPSRSMDYPASSEQQRDRAEEPYNVPNAASRFDASSGKICGHRCGRTGSLGCCEDEDRRPMVDHPASSSEPPRYQHYCYLCYIRCRDAENNNDDHGATV